MSNPAISTTAPVVNVRPACMSKHILCAGFVAGVTALCLSFVPFSVAQQVRPRSAADSVASLAASDPTILPDNPKANTPTPGTLPEASKTDKFIAPGQSAPKLKVRNKVLLGLKDAASANTIFAAAVAAGISHADNSVPHYGTNSSAYAQRFGAAMARGASYSIFSDSVMASVLREDPRYYRMGKQHKFVKRLAYAVTRPLISRTDGGHITPNLSLWIGHLGASWLTDVYYPYHDTTTTNVLETFGFSFIGSAIDNGVNEFIPGKFNILHNSRKVDY